MRLTKIYLAGFFFLLLITNSCSSETTTIQGHVHLISNDGSRVVYQQFTDETDQGRYINPLYSVPIEGGKPVKLSGDVVKNHWLYDDPEIVSKFNVSPDSRHVVYISSQEKYGVAELYSIPIKGGNPVKLNASLGDERDVVAFQISPDSRYVVYRADQDTNETLELYSVPIEGGNPVKLNGKLIQGGNISYVDIILDKYIPQINVRISPDSRYVVYQADQDVDEIFELYSVPIGGGNPVKLNRNLVDDGWVWRFQISSDSQYVVYLAEQEAAEVRELYSVPIGGGNPVKLNENLVDNGNVQLVFHISPDNRYVVYLANQEVAGVYELYSVPIGGGSPVKLNENLVDNGNVRLGFHISLDSRYVVYLADQEVDGVDELYSVPIGGGSSFKLNENLVDGGDIWRFQISSDSQYVVYLADQEVDGVRELYSVPIGGGNPVKLNGKLVQGRGISFNTTQLFPSLQPFSSIQISLDSRYVFYRADREIDEVDELYRVPIEGGNPVKLNGKLTQGKVVDDFRISPDSNRVTYETQTSYESKADKIGSLYSVSIRGTDSVRLD